MTEPVRQRLDGLKVAVVGDVHSGEDGLEELSGLFDRIKLREPDLILLLGDYITSPRSVSNLAKLRADISAHLARLAEIPNVAVLGNYETLSNTNQWLAVLHRHGIRAI
jgi:predicted MPP superfamily phosphohydrolase